MGGHESLLGREEAMSARVRVGAAWGLAVAVAASLIGPAAAQFRGDGPPRTEVRGIVKSVDAVGGSITLSGGEGRGEVVSEKTLPLAKDVEIYRTLSRTHGGHAGVWSSVETPGSVAEGDPVSVEA